MTREEAIKTLKENYCAMCAYGSQDMDSCDIRSCDNKDAIKALEQEPCEDAISREEAIDACNQSVNILEATDRIKDLPPVTSQEPFMNKPCVAHQICHEDKVKILDKIRERIELEKLGYPPSAGYYKAIVKVLQIIDKYKGNKAESEDK